MTVQEILLAVVCAIPAANVQAIMEPADRPVTLNGRIRMIHGYGPPGYGEDKKTDVHVSYFVIELPRPINIPCTPQRPELRSIQCGATKRLRLFFPSSSEDQLRAIARSLTGQKIAVVGRLQRRDTMGEMTPIYIDLTEIKTVPGESEAKQP